MANNNQYKGACSAYQLSTCSFCSVSSFSDAESVSLESPPLRTGGGVGLFAVGPLTDGRRATDEFREEETRGALTAERAVAPFEMEFGGEIETEDVRRDDGGVARPGREGAVVAMMPKIRYEIVTRSYV